VPVFTPPVVADGSWVTAETPPRAARLYRYYGPAARGRSVLRIGGAYSGGYPIGYGSTYITVDTPDQLTLVAAGRRDGVDYFLGGHVYTVTQADADALTAAGYGAYIAVDVADTAHTWGAYSADSWYEIRGFQWQEL